METKALWEQYHLPVYYFILKKVQEEDIAQEVLQNVFLKIHEYLHQLKDEAKTEAWIFQIVRNEINNYYRKQSFQTRKISLWRKEEEAYTNICCFDRFINRLPEIYKTPIRLVYIEGYSQIQTAQKIGISLANTKARIRRAKAILKENFSKCCKFEVNKDGKLIGEPDCVFCQ
ncbi:sigma-70 family RNA polymerase sigma factor [Rapidithrix thailandica]|uniref:Sigma-70 family RNA polymerase sigma factor n=1 Tax=Rapidithrix thailandica TaxID=413964 RepID=A0AAW9S3W9_9BACT